MIDNILIGGHEAEMRLLRQQLAARDLRSAASELLAMVDGSWEPTELFGEVLTIEDAYERELGEVERCLRCLRS